MTVTTATEEFLQQLQIFSKQLKDNYFLIQQQTLLKKQITDIAGGTWASGGGTINTAGTNIEGIVQELQTAALMRVVVIDHSPQAKAFDEESI